MSSRNNSGSAVQSGVSESICRSWHGVTPRELASVSSARILSSRRRPRLRSRRASPDAVPDFLVLRGCPAVAAFFDSHGGVWIRDPHDRRACAANASMSV